MTGPDFTTALTTLGLDNHQAAAWLGVSVRAVQRYRVTGAPGPVAGMVRLGLAGQKSVKAMELAADDMGCWGYFSCARKMLADSRELSLALDWRE